MFYVTLSNISKLIFPLSRISLFLLILLPLASNALIKPVPSVFPSIQGALNACNVGDTVLVMPGIYYENIVWPANPSIKLLSAGDSSNTFIDGNQLGRVLTFYPNFSIDSNTVVKGFTIRNGLVQGSWSYGGGIFVDGASPSFRELCICNNRLFTNINFGTYEYGGGIYLRNSNSTVIRTMIRNNILDSIE